MTDEQLYQLRDIVHWWPIIKRRMLYNDLIHKYEYDFIDKSVETLREVYEDMLPEDCDKKLFKPWEK